MGSMCPFQSELTERVSLYISLVHKVYLVTVVTRGLFCPFGLFAKNTFFYGSHRPSWLACWV